MYVILALHIPILAMRNNEVGHRINKMGTHFNKVGHRNTKLVVTYQQVVFKKQQNGSRVLYRIRPSLSGPGEVHPALTNLYLWKLIQTFQLHHISSMNANLVENELIAGFEWNLENPNQIDLTW